MGGERNPKLGDLSAKRYSVIKGDERKLYREEKT